MREHFCSCDPTPSMLSRSSASLAPPLPHPHLPTHHTHPPAHPHHPDSHSAAAELCVMTFHSRPARVVRLCRPAPPAHAVHPSPPWPLAAAARLSTPCFFSPSITIPSQLVACLNGRPACTATSLVTSGPRHHQAVHGRALGRGSRAAGCRQQAGRAARGTGGGSSSGAVLDHAAAAAAAAAAAPAGLPACCLLLQRVD